MGVRRAVDVVLDIAQRAKGRRIYTYGPLIHNPQTIALLQSRGITAVESVNEITDPRNSFLIVRAHGIAPEERKKIKASGVKIIDATCPKVGYVQAIIKKHTALDYTVVIAGDRKHPEVDGLWGYTDGRGIVIATVEEAKDLPPMDRVCIVAQTTQNAEYYDRIVQKIKEKSPQAVVFHTICSSTEKRQGEIIKLAREMDAIFVVGGKNSANTCRLVDLAQKENKPAFHIETAEEIKNRDLSSYGKIGISAGASTPNWIIDQVIDTIEAQYMVPRKKAGLLLKAWLWLVRMDIYSALGAACLTLAAVKLQGIPLRPSSVAVAALFVYAMHVLNRLNRNREAGLIGSFRESSYREHAGLHLAAATGSLLGAMALSLYNGLFSFIVLSFVALAGVLYNMKILPGTYRFRRLSDLPGSKNISTAIAWGIATAILPALHTQAGFSAAMAVAFLFTGGLVFIRSAMPDIMDMQSDKLLGRETIPVVIGKEKTQIILKIITLILVVILFISHPAGCTPTLSYFLILCPLYVWICLRLCDRRAGFSGAFLEGILQTSYIIAGFAVIGWYFLN